jgi:hypothetical protein
MNAVAPLLLASLLGATAPPGPRAGPSRPALKGCAWKKLSDPAAGLEVWVEPCDLGFRKIALYLAKSSLFVQFSDGGDPYPVVDVLDLLPGETPEAGMKRVFAARTDKTVAGRCVLAPYHEDKPRKDVKRFEFVPDAAYRKELDAKADPDEVPEPPCGDWGTSPDGISYFEAQPASGARKILYVRVGQDEPLFDEQTLRLLPAAGNRARPPRGER